MNIGDIVYKTYYDKDGTINHKGIVGKGMIIGFRKIDGYTSYLVNGEWSGENRLLTQEEFEKYEASNKKEYE